MLAVAPIMVGLCVAASILLVGCSERMEDDPEDLAVGIAQATYDRTFGTLELHAAPSLEDELLAAPEEGFESAAYWRLDDENLPDGELQTEGVQPLPVPLVPAGLSFYDVPATEPGGRSVTVTVAVVGTAEDDDYEYCAVGVRPRGADPYDDDLFEFVLGSEDSCGL